MNADQRRAVRNLIDRERRRALLVDAVGFAPETRLEVLAQMASCAGIDPAEVSRGIGSLKPLESRPRGLTWRRVP